MKCTNHFSKPIGLFFLLCLMPLWVYAQNITVKGIVKDNLGEPVIGASILQKGTTNGTVTDLNGEFAITIPSNSTITVSYIGYKTENIPVAGKKQLNIILKVPFFIRDVYVTK